MSDASKQKRNKKKKKREFKKSQMAVTYVITGTGNVCSDPLDFQLPS